MVEAGDAVEFLVTSVGAYEHGFAVTLAFEKCPTVREREFVRT
jgi:hypothetical protein